MNKRIFVILIGAVLILGVASPASAQENRTSFSGTCEMVPDGIPEWPDFRIWENASGSVSHWRSAEYLLNCVWSDERLPEYFVSVDNWNMFSNNNSYVAVFHAKGFSSNEQGNKLDLWEGSSHGNLDLNWNFTAYGVWQGLGEYQGLLAKFTLTNSPLGDWYDVAGEIIGSGE